MLYIPFFVFHFFSFFFQIQQVQSAEHEGASEFEIQYTAKEAGDFELHVWCDRTPRLTQCLAVPCSARGLSYLRALD